VGAVTTKQHADDKAALTQKAWVRAVTTKGRKKKNAGAWGVGVTLPPCAQLLGCELYVVKDTKREKKEKKRDTTSEAPRGERPRQQSRKGIVGALTTRQP